MKSQKGFTLVELVFCIVGLICAGGYIANIVKLVELAGTDTITTMFIVRIVGVVAMPLGVILGFF